MEKTIKILGFSVWIGTTILANIYWIWWLAMILFCAIIISICFDMWDVWTKKEKLLVVEYALYYIYWALSISGLFILLLMI